MKKKAIFIVTGLALVLVFGWVFNWQPQSAQAIQANMSNIWASSISNNNITWSWDVPLFATKYNAKLYDNASCATCTNPDDCQSAWSFTNITYSVSGLSVGDVRGLKIQACDFFSVCTAWSDCISNTAGQPTTAPAGLRISNKTIASLEIQWTCDKNATSYQVTGSGADGKTLATTFVEFAGQCKGIWSFLTADTTYSFNVKSCNSAGCSGSSTVEGKTDLIIATPSPVTVSNPTSASLKWDWNDVAGATSYTYELYEGGSCTDDSKFIKRLTRFNVSDYDWSGLTVGRTLSLQVQACTLLGACSQFSTCTTGTVTASAGPSTPTGLEVIEATTSRLEYEWTCDNAATSYQATGSGADGKTLTTTFYKFAGQCRGIWDFLTADTSYTFNVKACNEGGCSGNASKTHSTASIIATPSPVTVSNPTSDSLKWDWNDVAGATSYTYELYEGGSCTDDSKFIKTLTRFNVSDYNWGGLTVGRTLSLQVKACTLLGACSQFSTCTTGTVTASAPPMPANLTVRHDNVTSLEYDWTCDARATEYNFAGTGDDGKTTSGQVKEIGGVCRYTWNGLVANTRYVFTVEACNSYGCSREVSLTHTTNAFMPMPSVSVIATASSITWNWSSIFLATYYNYKAFNNGDCSGTAARGGDSEAFYDLIYKWDGLGQSVTKSFQVRACNAVGQCSSYSTCKSGLTPGFPPPPDPDKLAAPTGVALSFPGTNFLIWTWDERIGADKYSVNVYPNSENCSGSGFTAAVTSNRYKQSNLTPGQAYSIKVKACDDNGCSDDFSACAGGITINSSKDCSDSDGGKDYLVQGTTSDANSTRTDTCYKSGTGEVDTCSGSDCGVKEFFCSEGRVRDDINYIYCPNNGCSYGQCSGGTPPPAPGPAASDLIIAEGDYKVYQIVGGKRHWIPSIEAFNGYGLNWGAIKTVSVAAMQAYPRIELVREDGIRVFRLSENGVIRHIPSIEVFNSYNYSWNDIVDISSVEFNNYAVTNLIRLQGGTKVYLLEGNTKRWIISAEAFYAHGYDWNHIMEVNQSELDSYSTGTNISS